jgi:hypothetical protein
MFHVVESILSFSLVSFFSFKNFIANNEVYVTGLNDYGQLGISR